MRLIILIVH